MIRLLVVDDSAFARYAISRLVSADNGIEILGFARDGVEAIEKTKELKPDVITLDVEMPRMNGLDTLERIMDEAPTPSSWSSAAGEERAHHQALEIGAVDFFLRRLPTGRLSRTQDKLTTNKDGRNHARRGLRRQQVRMPLPPGPRKGAARTTTTSQGRRHREFHRWSGACNRWSRCCRGSAGGRRTCAAQAPGFTRSLAERLDELSQISVVEASTGARLAAGQALLAPGGYHLVFELGGVARLNQDPPIVGLRPAADVTMPSLSRLYGRETIGAVLTGMGSDGTRGSVAIKEAGGRIVAQDEETCVVYGMPRSVAEAQVVDHVVPLNEIAATITRLCRE
jgi:two-component system chemotaxis response regulator CheB